MLSGGTDHLLQVHVSRLEYMGSKNMHDLE